MKYHPTDPILVCCSCGSPDVLQEATIMHPVNSDAPVDARDLYWQHYYYCDTCSDQVKIRRATDAEEQAIRAAKGGAE